MAAKLEITPVAEWHQAWSATARIGRFSMLPFSSPSENRITLTMNPDAKRKLVLLLAMPTICTGCSRIDRDFESVHTGPREPGKRYLDKEEVHRCYIVVTSEPDDCDLIGVVRDRQQPVGRTPLRITVDVREKQWSNGRREVRIERVNELRRSRDIRKSSGAELEGSRYLLLAYLFQKKGYINKRFEETKVSGADLLNQPDRTLTIHVALDQETLAIRRTVPDSEVGRRVAFEVDVRLVEVGTGRADRATTGRAKDPTGFRDMAERIVFQLTKRLKVSPDAKVAVLDLEEIGEETVKGQYGRLIARMISTSLINTGKFDVVERHQLDRLLEERDLTAAQIAASPGEMGKILGLNYVVLGSAAKVR